MLKSSLLGYSVVKALKLIHSYWQNKNLNYFDTVDKRHMIWLLFFPTLLLPYTTYLHLGKKLHFFFIATTVIYHHMKLGFVYLHIWVGTHIIN